MTDVNGKIKIIDFNMGTKVKHGFFEKGVDGFTNMKHECFLGFRYGQSEMDIEST